VLITVDPGQSVGVATWNGRQLWGCGSGSYPINPTKGDIVWIESQVIYPHSKADPNDILTLAREAGRVAGRCEAFGAEVFWVKPSDWKGQLPKEIQHRRVWAALTEAEQATLTQACRGMAPSKRHNVLDAVGIGLWVLKRK
jgi:hypothetical protein